MKMNATHEITLLKRALADAKDTIEQEHGRAEQNAIKAKFYDSLAADIKQARGAALLAEQRLTAYIETHTEELRHAKKMEETARGMWRDGYAQCTCGAYKVFT